MTAAASPIIAETKFAWWQQMWWAGGCLQATEAEINGSVSVCFSAAAGKQAPSCQLRYGPLKAVAQSQRWVHSLYSNSCPVHRSCYGSTLQIYVAQESGDVGPHWLFLCVLHRRLAPTPGTAEQNKYQNIISIYIYLLKSIVRLHLTVELGLKHLGNNLHIMSTTPPLPPPLPPFPPAAQSKPTS